MVQTDDATQRAEQAVPEVADAGAAASQHEGSQEERKGEPPTEDKDSRNDSPLSAKEESVASEEEEEDDQQIAIPADFESTIKAAEQDGEDEDPLKDKPKFVVDPGNDFVYDDTET